MLKVGSCEEKTLAAGLGHTDAFLEIEEFEYRSPQFIRKTVQKPGVGSKGTRMADSRYEGVSTEKNIDSTTLTCHTPLFDPTQYKLGTQRIRYNDLQQDIEGKTLEIIPQLGGVFVGPDKTEVFLHSPVHCGRRSKAGKWNNR
jgi:hypothetical protein